MPKSKKAKELSYERRLKHLQELHGVVVTETTSVPEETHASPTHMHVSSLSEEDLAMSRYFKVDLRRSLAFIVGIFTLEILWYFVSMNNYLSKLIKF